jgi:hypothetical protein
MAYDFGDGSGNLDVPDIEALYPVAYDEGALISSNSWGGGNYYYPYLGECFVSLSLKTASCSLDLRT